MRCVVGGVDPADLPDPVAALAALEAVGFVVSLELRRSAVTDLADVVLPVAPVAEKAGTFVDWEGRGRAVPRGAAPHVRPGRRRRAHLLAEGLGTDLGLSDAEATRAELAELEPWTGARVDAPARRRPPPRPRRRARWPWPPGTRCSTPVACRTVSPTSRAPRVPRSALVSAATAAAAGVADGELVTVSSAHGSVSVRSRSARAGRRRLAADQRRRLCGTPRPPGRCRCVRDAHPGRSLVNLLSTVTPSTGFGDDPWWLIALTCPIDCRFARPAVALTRRAAWQRAFLA